MSSGYLIKINYRDGRTEERIVDDYSVKDGCLNMHVRFGVESGKHCIPLDLIKEFIIDR